jgi:hypothetical protein
LRDVAIDASRSGSVDCLRLAQGHLPRNSEYLGNNSG